MLVLVSNLPVSAKSVSKNEGENGYKIGKW